jgi:hypothetical protein
MPLASYSPIQGVPVQALVEEALQEDGGGVTPASVVAAVQAMTQEQAATLQASVSEYSLLRRSPSRVAPRHLHTDAIDDQHGRLGHGGEPDAHGGRTGAAGVQQLGARWRPGGFIRRPSRGRHGRRIACGAAWAPCEFLARPSRAG